MAKARGGKRVLCAPTQERMGVTLLQQPTSRNHMFFLTSVDWQKSLVCILHCGSGATLS